MYIKKMKTFSIPKEVEELTKNMLYDMVYNYAMETGYEPGVILIHPGNRTIDWSKFMIPRLGVNEFYFNNTRIIRTLDIHQNQIIIV